MSQFFYPPRAGVVFYDYPNALPNVEVFDIPRAAFDQLPGVLGGVAEKSVWWKRIEAVDHVLVLYTNEPPVVQP